MSKGQRATIAMLATIAWMICDFPSAFAQWVPYGPGARARHSAVYDSATTTMIVFGGTDLGTINYDDVWVASSVLQRALLQWSFENPTGTAPAGRSGHSAVYDSVNSRMIVFGGAEGFPSPCANDVWMLQNANGLGGTPGWVELNPGGKRSSLPPPRVGHVAAYDPNTDVMMVFGGSNCSGGYLNDFWVFSNANGLGGTPAWKQITPSGTPPPARAYAVAGYNSTNNTLVIYGGTDGAELSDVWVLSGADGTTGTSAWSQVSPSGTAPAVRYGAAYGYDQANDRLIINGGYSTRGVLADTWVLDSATGAAGSPSWVSVTTSNNASQLYFHSGIYVASASEFLVFGGISQRSPQSTVAQDDMFLLSGASSLAKGR